MGFQSDTFVTAEFSRILSISIFGFRAWLGRVLVDTAERLVAMETVIGNMLTSIEMLCGCSISHISDFSRIRNDAQGLHNYKFRRLLREDICKVLCPMAMKTTLNWSMQRWLYAYQPRKSDTSRTQIPSPDAVEVF